MSAKKVAKKRPRPVVKMGPKVLADPEILQVPAGKPVARRTEGDRAAEEAAERRRQEAFDAEFSFRGERLEPLSISREMVFLQLRTAMGAPSLFHALADGGTWLPDALRILWLCSHLPEDWRELRAESHELQAVIDAWAEGIGLREEGVRAEVLDVTVRIWNASQMNAHVPAASGKGDEPGN